MASSIGSFMWSTAPLRGAHEDEAIARDESNEWRSEAGRDPTRHTLSTGDDRSDPLTQSAGDDIQNTGHDQNDPST